jgi:acylpyruvate hydrolase
VRLATLTTERGPRLHMRGTAGYVDVADATRDAYLSTLNGLLAADALGRADVLALASSPGTEFPPDSFGPAVPDPPRILCVGVNYREHATEAGRAIPTWPEAFVRGPDSVVGPYADLTRPALTERFDYEGELGVVIGRGGRYLSAEKALDAVAGFVVVNDATARDWQRAGTQWTGGKNFDGSMPVGPELVTPDEVDLGALRLTTRLNGTVMQQATTAQMIVDVAGCVEFFSSFTTLRPGDLIATGTPGGVGFARTPPVWLTPGDVVEVEIDGVGTLRNRVVEETGAPADWRWRPDGRGATSL